MPTRSSQPDSLGHGQFCTSELTQVASYKAQAKPVAGFTPNGSMAGSFSVQAPDGLTYKYKDGMMVVKGRPAVSQTAEQLKPPQSVARVARRDAKMSFSTPRP